MKQQQPPNPVARVPEGGATILIIEDSDTLRRGLRETLAQTGFFDQLLTAADGFEGYRLLRQNSVDIVLCDLQMPRCDGLGFLRLQQRDPAVSDVPVIVLTASDDWQTKVKALDSGASDYLAKPAHPEETRARLSVHLKIKQLRDGLKQKTEDLERLSRTDGLTGVLNRRHFDQTLNTEYGRAQRYGRPFSMLMVDIDHFKRLNDTYGHQAGDEALRSMAHLLTTQLRAQDVVCRYGGEEFAILLPETDAKSALRVAGRLRQSVSSLRIAFDGNEIRMTASFGVAGLPNEGVAQPADLVAAADSALYAAKHAGRNRAVVAPSARPDLPAQRRRLREHSASV